MTFPAAQIALMVNGKLEGDAAIAVTSFGKIEDAVEGQLTFFANSKYEEFLYSTKASIIIIQALTNFAKVILNIVSSFNFASFLSIELDASIRSLRFRCVVLVLFKKVIAL